MTRRTEVLLRALIAGAAIASAAPSAQADDAGHAIASPGFSPGSEPTKGAYFYKVSSEPRGDAVGIVATGVLPRVTFDPAREHVPARSAGEDEYARGPLDVPDVYMGAHATTELDCGLSWSRVLDDGKRPLWTDDPSGSDMRHPEHALRLELSATSGLTAIDGTGARFSVRASETGDAIFDLDALADTKVDLVGADGATARSGVTLRPDFAFRPYWRTMTHGSSSGKYVNQWANPEPGDAGYLWLYPGERFQMSVQTVAKERVRFRVGLVGDPKVQLDVTFAQAGFGPGVPTEWKRVASIDQFRELADGRRKGNEDLAVIPTKTRVEGARWESSALILASGRREAMVGSRFVLRKDVELGARFSSVFATSGFTSGGGETITIAPTPTPGISGKLGSP